MSAEPGRKAPYSCDIRWRVVWQRAGMELPFRRIASNLNLSLGTVHRIWKCFEETGEVSPSKQPIRYDSRVLDKYQEILVVGLIMDDPSLYLQEVCHKVAEITDIHVSTTTVCCVLHKHGLTRKKIQQISLQRCSEYRGDFMAEVHLYNTAQYVWVDETGCNNKDHIRKFGYAMKGDYPVCHRIFHRGQRISAIAAMTLNGILAVDLKKGSVGGDVFFDFVGGFLIPNMVPFDGDSPNSIVILDNCSIHHVRPVIDLFRDAGILVLFLPPYSPDYNPIELVFSKVKYFLKQHDDVLQAMDNPEPIIRSAFASITPQDCLNYVMHCGYP